MQLLLLEKKNQRRNIFVFKRVEIKDHYTRLHDLLQILAIKALKLVSPNRHLSSFLHTQYTDDVILRAFGLDLQSHWSSSLHSIIESHQTSGRNSSTKISVLRTVQIFTFFSFTTGLLQSQGYNSALSNVFLHHHTIYSPLFGT